MRTCQLPLKCSATPLNVCSSLRIYLEKYNSAQTLHSRIGSLKFEGWRMSRSSDKHCKAEYPLARLERCKFSHHDRRSGAHAFFGLCEKYPAFGERDAELTSEEADVARAALVWSANQRSLDALQLMLKLTISQLMAQVEIYHLCHTFRMQQRKTIHDQYLNPRRSR